MSHDTEIIRALELLFQPGDVFEIRVLDAERGSFRRPHVESGYFDYEHRAEVPRALAEIATAAGVYTTINPVDPALLARAANRLAVARRNQSAGNADVLRRRWLFIDIDPVRPAGISATDAEKTLAFDRTMEMRGGLASMGWPQPVVVDSGNGCYLLYRIDLPPDDNGLVQRCLQALQPLSDEKVHIDLSVANAARICRLPGTWNRKGDDMPDRPHRLATILDAPGSVEPVAQALLEDLAARAPADTGVPPSHLSHSGQPPSHISDNGDSPPHSSDIGRVRSDIPHTAPCPSDISDIGHVRSDIPHSAPSPSDNSHIATSPPHNPHTAAHDADISHRPGDDFNRCGDVRAILVQAGWTLTKPGENEHWRRPGKSSGNHSATLKDGVFYVFSANAAPFEPNRAYSPFAVYTLLTHNGDYETAASALRTSGYGGDPASDIHPGVDISGIMRMPVAQGASRSHNAHPGQMSDSPVAQGAPAFDLQTFSDTPERQIVWLWPGVIPRGMPSLIAGKQGLGKSFLICDIAARVSTGRPMPDGQPGTPGNVLLLAREDDASCVLLPRLKAAKANLQRVWWSVFANASTGSPIDLAEHIDLLTQTAVERRFDLIVVDTFAAFAPAGTDSNAAQDVRLLLDALTRLARATGAAVVVVAHLRKTGQGDGDPMDAIAGSVQMTAGVRVASMLEKGVADGERWFRVVKSNLGRIDEHGWTWRFAWPDPFTEGASTMPYIEWMTATPETVETARRQGAVRCDPRAVREALCDVLANGPQTQREACTLVAAALRQSNAKVQLADVALEIARLASGGDSGVEKWCGARGAKMVGLPGSRPEDTEERVRRLAIETPGITLRRFRALAGCSKDIADRIFHEVNAREDKPHADY